MKGIGDKLLGSTERFPFEQRIFSFAVLIGITLTMFGTIMDAYYGDIVWADISFLVFWIVTYFILRSGNGYRIISVIAISIFIFAFIPYEWIICGGTRGAIPYYTIIFIAMAAMILREPLRKVMIVSMLAVVSVLIGLEIYSGQLSWDSFYSNIIHLIAVLIATALLIVVYSNTYMKEKQRSDDYAQTINAHARQQLYYVENLENLIGKLKSERHDFNNHLSVIHGLLENGDIEKAKLYSSRLVKDAAEYQTIVNVPYPAVRALLNHKLSSARNEGIELCLNVGLPEGLKLNEFDIAAMLGNLLDNAIEACVKLVDTTPHLSLTLKFQPDYLIIRISNPFITDTEIRCQSSKPDTENHGFGLKNVKYLVEKNNGLIEIRQDSSVFSVDIALLVE